MEGQLQPFRKVQKWLQRTQDATQPHFSAVHQMLHKASASAVEWKGSMKGQSRL